MHSAKKKYFAQPGLLFMEAIVNYRVQNHFWPGSMRDFAMSSEANHQLAEDFKYNGTNFKISDSNHLKIIFYDYKKNADNPSTAGKIDLNGLRGVIRFFNFDNSFAYKLEMK